MLRKREPAVTENFEVVLGLENAPHTTEISEVSYHSMLLVSFS